MVETPAMHLPFLTIRARCQKLSGFVREAWRVLEPNQPYVHNWHIDAVCLPGGTLIETEAGPQRIDLLVSTQWAGRVLSFNHKLGRTEWRAIAKHMKSPRGHPIAFNTLSGLRFSATGNHPVFVVGRGYVRADQVKIGDRLVELQALCGGVQAEAVDKRNVLQSGVPLRAPESRHARREGHTLRLPCGGTQAPAGGDRRTVEGIVASIERDVRLSGDLYNLEVEGNNNYFANGVLLHNCDHLEAITVGRINRLLINVPPGTMKSMLVSVLWPAWEWGPMGLRSMRFLTTSFAEGNVKRDTRKHRDLTISDWYQALWPEVRLTRTGEMSFANADTGTREGVAFASLTSRRGDRLIIDDPHSTETAESETERANTTRLFREGATNRLNNQEKSAIVVVMQRLHEQDVSGTIKRYGMEYVHLMLPMEFEVDRACETTIGFRDPRTDEGELLDPVRFGRKVVDDLKRDMGAYAYAGQYQQRPAPRDGGLFKRAWFELVRALPGNVVRRVRSWDLAATVPKPGRDPDFTAGLLMSKSADGIYYIEGVIRLRDSSMNVEHTIKNTAAADGVGVTVTLPQDPGQAGKAQAANLVKLLAGYPVKIISPTGDKSTRARPAEAQAEAGNIKILATGDPIRDAWIEPFLAEITTFPAAAHDDQVDVLSDAFNQLALGHGPATVTTRRM